jgi:hypothetical protein
MRCALCYKGVFIINHFLSGKSSDSEYLSRIENSIVRHKEIFFSKKYEFDVFITTYNVDPEMVNSLNYFLPKDIDVLDFDTAKKENNSLSQISQHRNIVKQIKKYESENGIKYDLIVITRLDLEFHKKFEDMDFNKDLFNIVVHHKSGNCDDNLWIFPRKYLDLYDSSLEYLDKNSKITHEINHELLKNNIDIHYMDRVIDTYMGHTYFSFIR